MSLISRRDSGLAGTLVRPDELTFTVVSTHDRVPLAKRYWLSETGELNAQTAATLVRGTIRVEHAPSLEAFGERLGHLDTHQSVLYGIPPLAEATVVTQKEFERTSIEHREGVITRTREHLQFAPAPGVAMMDFDAVGAPAEVLDAVASPEKTREVLLKAVPELAAAPMLWRPSSSSYLYHGTREVQGLRGQRVYIPVARASDIPALGELLYERLWLLGYGYFAVSASGQLLDRTPLDRSVWQPERLDFAAGPLCEAPLERRLASARLWNPEAPYFDPRGVKGLTAQEQRAINAKRKAARAVLRDAARNRRVQWARERGMSIAATTGLDEGSAVAVASEAVEHRVLCPDFLLVTEDQECVPVSQLLAQPDIWHGRRFCDPLEPDYRGDNRIAWVNLRPSRGRPYLHSHAHGGTRYTLSNGRKVIRLVDGQLPRVVDECSEIIVLAGEMYQLKDQIVRVTEDGYLAPIEPEWIADWMQRNADFVRPKRVDGAWQDCPTDLAPKYARTLLAKSGEIGLPGLVAVTTGPFLRPDGSVVDEPGYDEPTQVLYTPTGPTAPSVRRTLTLTAAEEALRHLWGPFREFPFAGDMDRGGVLALLLTAALRPGIATAPGGLIESHEAGSGKTLLARALANLTGAPAIPQALAQSEEEIRKALFSAARAGTPSVLYDNIGRDRALDSASLAMALTSGTIADRILGESTYASVPFRSLLLLTGNNTRITGDLNRRLIRVRIAPKVENPWRRVFDFDPSARTEANWLNLRVASLELVQAMLADGPPSMEGGSGYPEWDTLVRATVCWVARRLDIGVGLADPAQSMVMSYDDDPERDRLRRLLSAWHAVWGSEPMTVRQILEGVEEHSSFTPADDVPQERREALSHLRDVLREIDARLGNHAIGIYLNQQKGRIVNDMELVNGGKHCGSSRWTVRRVGDGGAAR